LGVGIGARATSYELGASKFVEHPKRGFVEAGRPALKPKNKT